MSGEVADHRHDQIALFERSHERIVALRREETALVPLEVGFGEQLAVRRVVAARPAAAALELQRQPGVDEGLMESMDRREVDLRQRHPEAGKIRVELRGRRRGARIARRAVDPARERVRRRAGPALHVAGRRTAEQQRQILDARRRFDEQRLEEQVQQEIVAPDVDDERDGWPEVRDIREVLIRADADVRAAGEAGRRERGHHMQVRPLVRDQVVRVEVAFRLGQLRDAGGKGGRRRSLAAPQREYCRERDRDEYDLWHPQRAEL
jgi:hypothetical protein